MPFFVCRGLGISYLYDDLNDFDEESHVTINHIETHCVPKRGGDETGEILSGTLSLEGPVVLVKLRPATWSGCHVRGPSGQVFHIHLDEERRLSWDNEPKTFC